MTLAMVADWMDSFQRTAVDPACSEIRLRRAATVRLADELLGRCEEKLHHSCFCRATMPLGEHGKHCKTVKLIADIRKIRGGGANGPK